VVDLPHYPAPDLVAFIHGHGAEVRPSPWNRNASIVKVLP
jgi:hypothetical protein